MILGNDPIFTGSWRLQADTPASNCVLFGCFGRPQDIFAPDLPDVVVLMAGSVPFLLPPTGPWQWFPPDDPAQVFL